MPPGPRVATASQDLRLPGRTADQGLPGQTLCASLCPDPGHAQTGQDGLQPHGGPGWGGSREEVPALPGRSLVFTFKNMVLLADNRKKPKNCRKVQNL